ncbi:hypothetical protein JYT20_01305 [Rhodothermus sp. AH-315-K08]|nr:hypothetical protein [Rhodothermus sp. AH-315-K08]
MRALLIFLAAMLLATPASAQAITEETVEVGKLGSLGSVYSTLRRSAGITLGWVGVSPNLLLIPYADVDDHLAKLRLLAAADMTPAIGGNASAYITVGDVKYFFRLDSSSSRRPDNFEVEFDGSDAQGIALYVAGEDGIALWIALLEQGKAVLAPFM